MSFIESFDSSKLVLGNPDQVKEKIQKLVKAGPDLLQVIVDFDYTLTRAHKDGRPVECSWGVLETYKDLPASYHTRVQAAKDKYLPIELDLTISKEEKVPLMIEWYKEANKCLAESGVRSSWLPKMVCESNCELRDDTDKMLGMMKEANIPVLVMSAGVGDLIQEILKHFSLVSNNMSVVSNFLQFDTEGNIIGLSESDDDMIHMYNKADMVKKKTDGVNSAHRKNVILLGDSLGDLDMAAGVADPDTVLTIGFLNKNIEKNLPVYQKSFDVVLVDDQSMQFPNLLLSEIVNQKSS